MFTVRARNVARAPAQGEGRILAVRSRGSTASGLLVLPRSRRASIQGQPTAFEKGAERRIAERHGREVEAESLAVPPGARWIAGTREAIRVEDAPDESGSVVRERVVRKEPDHGAVVLEELPHRAREP